MPAAEKRHVGQAGLTTVSPMDKVMGITPTDTSVTSRPRAPTVPVIQRSSDGRGNRANTATDIERDTVTIGDHANDPCIARELS